MNRSTSLRRADFQQVWDKGKAWSHPLMIMRAHANGMAHCRFGFVSGKKIGNAVRRNRVKRLMREAVRHHVNDIMPGWDIIFISRTEANDADFQTIAAAVDTLLRRANLIRS